MNTVKKILMLFTVTFISACTGGSSGGGNAVLCDAGKATASVVAGLISQQLSCSNIPAITQTLEEKLAATNICQSSSSSASAPAGVVTQKSIIGSMICPMVIDSLFATGLSQIPASWGCTGQGNLGTIKATLIAACEKSI